MDISAKVQDIKARALLLAGPLFISFIIFAISLRQTSTPLILPLTALAGLVVSYLWKWRGVAYSSIFLMGVLGLSLHSLHNHHWVWVIALALTIATTFVVTALCTEESYRRDAIPNKGGEDSRQLASRFNEQLQMLQKQHAGELQENASYIEQLRQELSIKEDKIRSNEHLIKLVRDEMSATYSHQEKLMQELFQTRQQLARIEGIVGSDADSFIANEVNKSAVEEVEKLLQLAREENLSLARELELINQSIKRQQESYFDSEKHLRQQIEENSRVWASEKQKLSDELSLAKEAIALSQSDLRNQLEENSRVWALEKQKLSDELSLAKEALEVSQKASFEDSEKFRLVIEQLNSALEQAENKVKETEVRVQEAEDRWKEAEKAFLSHKQLSIDEQRKLREELEGIHSREKASTEEVKQLKDALSDHHRNESQLKDELNKLNEQCLDLQTKLHHAEAKLSEASTPVAVDDRELRRIEAMYQQLKQQFNEKSEVLSATRRELFFKEEQLLALQKDFEEAIIAHDVETGVAVEKALAQAEQELHGENDWQLAEIGHLHELIDKLNKAMSPSK